MTKTKKHRMAGVSVTQAQVEQEEQGDRQQTEAEPCKPRKGKKDKNLFGGTGPPQWSGQESYSVLAANITTWGNQAKLYFADLEADFCMITEHRQVKAGAAKMQLQLEAAGWRAAVTEGKTTEVGVSGGTLVV